MLKNDFKAIMLQFVNIVYLWAGKSPVTGLDCSGLVEQLLRIIGVDPPATQNAQSFYNYFSQRPHTNEFKTGALCFYGSSPQSITHIGMSFDDEEAIIESRGGTSQTINAAIAGKQDACTSIRPCNHRKDLVAVIFPDEIKEKLT